MRDYTGLMDIWRALILSLKSSGALSNEISTSDSRNVIQVSSAVAFAIARYSTSTLDLETVGCFLETHEMRLDPRYTQMPEMLLLVFGQPTNLHH